MLSYFCSGPASKKKRYLKDERPEGGPLEDEPEPPVENTLGSSSTQSSTTTKDNTPANEGRRPSPSCSSSGSSSTDRLSIGLINKRDPAHGPALAMAHFREGSFQPRDLNFPKTDGRKFRPEWYNMFSWLEYSPLDDKAFCFVCRAFYNPKEKKTKTMQKMCLHSVDFPSGRKL